VRAVADDPLSMEQKMALLRRQYAQKIEDRIADLQTTIRRLGHAEGGERLDSLVIIRDATHKLAGSGATFGFPVVTEYAREMEHACIWVLENPGRESDEDAKTLNANLEKLSQRLLDDVVAQCQEVAEVDDSTERIWVPQLHGSARKKVLIVMEYDGTTAAQVRQEMNHYGFDVRIVDHPNKMLDDLKSHGGVDVIVTGLLFDQDTSAALSALAMMREDSEFKDISVVVNTVLDTMSARLGAVHAGAKAYLVKPVDLANLIDVLDHVTHNHEDEQFRVLIVDDDETLASYTELVLQGAGMDTKIVFDPMDVFDALDLFSPELILLDLYMPTCDGREVAGVIRQREEYAGIPIVFLSGESDKDKQLSAMELGGDDFLTKPIRASHLISSVQIRAARFRELRSFMTRDSMTGLFNHTTTKQFLGIELARAQRNKTDLAVVSLDIDHFKVVNDTYGHGVGDRVIKALARLLRLRLRSADIIGRMGGEEFSAILIDTGVDEAAQVFDIIRKVFSEIEFTADDQTFRVTISCGVAAVPDYNTAQALSDAADKALYAAKNGGRNQVVKAP